MNFFTKAICVMLSFFYTVSAYLGLSTGLAYPKKVELSKIDEAVFENENFALSFKSGKFSVAFDGVTMFEDAVSQAKLDGKIISSENYDSFDMSAYELSDKRGNGTLIKAKLEKVGLPAMEISFSFYEGENFFLIDEKLISKDESEVATNYIAPIVIKDGSVQNGKPKWTNFLEVPFDNDSWAEFEATNLFQSGISHEVGAFFTPDTKDGFVVGSVTHDKWKSAVEYTNGLGRIDTLTVYSGANTVLTRDQSPHGTVHGDEVSSAVFMVGFYKNWKDGMNEYGKINITFTPKRTAVIDTTPIGWNSWGSIQSDLRYNNAIATSDYIKENFQSTWKDEENVVYCNLDSYWDFLSDAELRDFVRHCEENGQVPGVYSAPFVIWWDEEGMKNNYVPGTGISYNDIRLKKADGSFYGNDIDGCFPLDVTHPATLIHFKTQLEKLKDYGFKYIKLDFLVHASLEGDYYNKDIQTGIEAYNYAMGKVAEILGDDMFINLSMAPLFPYNYANGRRLCCDSYYKMKDTRYVLNSVTYGFWESEIYDFIDPDHIVLWGRDGKAMSGEANARMLSGAVTGGSFLAGDNFVNPKGNSKKAFERYDKLLTNKELIEIVKLGKTFEPQISNKTEYAANIFTLEDGGKTYIAVFNYSFMPSTFYVKLPYYKCNVRNLLTGKEKTEKYASMGVTLGGYDAVMFEVSPK